MNAMTALRKAGVNTTLTSASTTTSSSATANSEAVRLIGMGGGTFVATLVVVPGMLMLG